MKCWQITPQPSRNTMLVRYWGLNPTDALAASLEELERAMPKVRTKLVVDLREVIGHNPSARHLWQDFLLAHKDRLEAVYLITPRAATMHRMVASVLGLAVGLRLRLVESPDEIP
ncbi:MAG TPA: hypothetical protein VFS00_23455 [Polyangiaceae bacterium]|nr:hypothetical protein [Polyangiaceae bacterium]